MYFSPVTAKRKRSSNKENEHAIPSISSPGPPPKRTRRSDLLAGSELRQAVEHQQLIRRAENNSQGLSSRETRLSDAGASDRHAEAREAIVSDFLNTVRNSEESLGDVLLHLLRSKDVHTSSWISRTLGTHGQDILGEMKRRQPEKFASWVNEDLRKQYAKEGKRLATRLRQNHDKTIAACLEEFNLSTIMADVKKCAPGLWDALAAAGTSDTDDGVSHRRNRDLIYTTIACMLAQARSERSNDFQVAMCFWLLASGASRSQFDVLHHAGFSSSYTTVLRNLKKLAGEKLQSIRSLVQERAFLIVWDNLNIAFRVGEERTDSKDHFDNGTTATLFVVFGVALGELANTLKPPRPFRSRTYAIDGSDVRPTAQQICNLENAHVWHIIDILFEEYPILRERFGKDHTPPSVLMIPVHKSEQYPLPAVKIDESSIDGTIGILEYIITEVLQMDEELIRQHGTIICAGDQLTISLLDKAGAVRRDDKSLINNFARYTEGQLGLFHVKMASTRMIANEFWGTSGSPWSLWRIHALLHRKLHTTPSWKAKKLAPFPPIWELILSITLPANILDGFRIYCSYEDTASWVEKIESYDQLQAVAKQVQLELTSRRRVDELREAESLERDVPLENIILFNHDALTLREFRYAIKRGDIGSVVDILSFWMIEFRGTGSMPRYAEAVLECMLRLREMGDKERYTYLMNWLVNLSGLPDNFKELDLNQEHHNRWAKIIYSARGSNRSWNWLSIITLCIWSLRNVIRNVNFAFCTPHNSTSHTSPSTQKDIKIVTDYLKSEAIQTYTPLRPNNNMAVPSRDLFVEGMAHGNTSGAFKGQRFDKRHARFKTRKTQSGQTRADNVGASVDPETTSDESLANGFEQEEAETSGDSGDSLWDSTGEITLEDLATDKEEYPNGIDVEAMHRAATQMLEDLAEMHDPDDSQQ